MPSEKQKLQRSRLYVDENVLEKIGINDAKDQLLVFLDMLREYCTGHNGVLLGAEYWDFPVGANSKLYDFLYGDDGAAIGLDRDQLRELQIYMGRCKVSNFPTLNITAVTGSHSATYTSPAYAQAFSDVEDESIYPSMLCELPPLVSGAGALRTDIVSKPCFFVHEAGTVSDVCRGMLRSFLPTRDEFHFLSGYAFPHLILHPDLDLQDFKLQLNMYFGTVLDHLSYLNDSFIMDADEVGWDIHKMVARAAQYMVFSDEGDRTKRDRAKMKLRSRSFNVQGQVVQLCCTLHSKITGHLGGRIHFHGPVPDIAPDKVFVAVFVDHLAI